MSYAAAAFALFAAYEQLSLSTSRKEGEYDDDANIAPLPLMVKKYVEKATLLLIIMIQADTIYYLDAKR
jgi:hypothetical protein